MTDTDQTSSGLRARLVGSLPATRASRIIALNALVGSTGTGLFLAGSAIYFTRFADVSEPQLGVVLAIAGAIGLATTVPIGRLGDRYGPRNVLVAAAVWRAAGYIAYLFISGFTQFLVAACLLYLVDRAGQPLNQALVGRLITGTERNRTMGFIRSLHNVGFTIGFGLAGIALTVGTVEAFRLLFIGNALSFVVIALTLLRLPNVDVRVTDDSDKPEPVVPPIRDRSFVTVTLANGILFLHDAMLTVVLPLWVAEHTEAPIWMVTALVVTNTVLTIFCQVPVTRHIADPRSARRSMWVSACTLSAACGAFTVSGHTDGAIATAVALFCALLLLTMAELLHSAASWEVSFAMSPIVGQGRYLAFYDLGFSAAEIIGPVVLLWLIAHAGPEGWLFVAAVLPLAALISNLGSRHLPDTPTPDPAEAGQTSGSHPTPEDT
ncbi:MFS transporter [Aeromicrobium fastidiosum]|uniref:MFS transporter n=1 Tax=Aeromicrobium fastidiosum TaxID=52699 RepID=A0A641AV24_9ACTN|nr:MFS transporter [Aeromicrobium fastidiosum]KAA1380688.1 MFS transporter [Aeromicrobium fastidiosum]MBP2390300.1 MFS family permease [Aeromicrobium fastidiosum]